MLKLIFYVASVCVFISTTYGLSYNTQKAELGQFSSTVIIEDLKQGKLFAGGAIIHVQYVLTSNFTIQFGSYHALVIAGEVDFDNPSKGTRQIRAVTHHFSRFSENKNEPPLEILRLDQPFKIDEYVNVAKLSFQPLKKRMEVQVAGIGEVFAERFTTTSQLMYANMTIASRKRCTLRVRGQSEEYVCLLPQSKTNVRAGAADIGSPVYLDGKVIGILSPIVDQYKTNFSTVQLLRPHVEWINKVLSTDIGNDPDGIAISIDGSTPEKRRRPPVFKEPLPEERPPVFEEQLPEERPPVFKEPIPEERPPVFKESIPEETDVTYAPDEETYDLSESTDVPEKFTNFGTSDLSNRSETTVFEYESTTAPHKSSETPRKRKHQNWPPISPNSRFENQIRENDFISDRRSDTQLESQHFSIGLSIKIMPCAMLIVSAIILLKSTYL